LRSLYRQAYALDNRNSAEELLLRVLRKTQRRSI